MSITIRHLGLAFLLAGPGLFPTFFSARALAQLSPEALRPPAPAPLRAQWEKDLAAARDFLAKGHFAAAARKLEPLARHAPDDLDVHYLLARAYRLQGQLANAEKTTQWMLDLRPEFAGALWEAALLREQFQDLAGAVDLLNVVYHRTPASSTETRIAILEDLARLFDKQNNPKDAGLLRQELARLKGPKP
jgi:tetratricopeptide (TPR) repeat protein